MLKLLASSCFQGRLQNLSTRFPASAANGGLQSFPFLGSLRNPTRQRAELQWQKALFSSESGDGDGGAEKSMEGKTAEEAEYASAGLETEDGKTSSAIVSTNPRPEDHLTYVLQVLLGIGACQCQNADLREELLVFFYSSSLALLKIRG
ncbi:hypothetical protein KSP39_PZI002676 [Platanthera zijinensis]|uniref:Uncharacterized protein n=1 Tax=Platanthera zijinensis TaxID=2320716 RepID=A0AAP0BZ83_9ASPA